MSVIENIVDEYRIRLTEVGLEINKENLDEYKDGLIEKFEMFEKIGVVNIPLQNVYSFIQEEDGELEEYKCGFRIEE